LSLAAAAPSWPKVAWAGCALRAAFETEGWDMESAS
jgi:hypothetical protein